MPHPASSSPAREQLSPEELAIVGVLDALRAGPWRYVDLMAALMFVLPPIDDMDYDQFRYGNALDLMIRKRHRVRKQDGLIIVTGWIAP